MAEYYDRDKAAYDSAAKRLLSKKSILAHILKGVVPEFAGATIEDIEKHYIEQAPQLDVIPADPDYMPDIVGKRRLQTLQLRQNQKSLLDMASHELPRRR